MLAEIEEMEQKDLDSYLTEVEQTEDNSLVGELPSIRKSIAYPCSTLMLVLLVATTVPKFKPAEEDEDVKELLAWAS